MKQKDSFYSGKHGRLSKNLNRPLNVRQKLYVETLVHYGFHEAKRITGYSRAQIWRLLNNERVKLYRQIVVERAQSNCGISLTEIIRELMAMVDDPKVSPRIKVEILERLIDLQRE